MHHRLAIFIETQMRLFFVMGLPCDVLKINYNVHSHKASFCIDRFLVLKKKQQKTAATHDFHSFISLFRPAHCLFFFLSLLLPFCFVTSCFTFMNRLS